MSLQFYVYYVTLIRKFVLVALLFLSTYGSGNDCRWCPAVEFWSSVVCSMENSKTVYFHGVLDNSRNSILLERCFEAFAHSVPHKCTITAMLRTYVFSDPENYTSSIDNNDVIYGISKPSSIWKITSEDELLFLETPTATEIFRGDSKDAFGTNTWNVHVILVRNIRSFNQISKDDSSTFEWKQYDRFIVLIACQEETLNKPRLDGVLKMLWSKRKVQSVLVTVLNNARLDRAVRTYNPFAKINDSAYGRVEVINVKTVEEASSLLSHLTYYRTNNMNGYELKAGLFAKTTDNDKQTKVEPANNHDFYNYEDIDNKMLDTMAKRMNFTVRVVSPTDNKYFGHQLSNGTYVGAIGDVVHGRTDICFESFFIKKYSNNSVEDINFSMYMDFDKLCVIVPKATKIPKEVRMYHFFPLSVWIAFVLSQAFVYLTWYFLQIFTPGRTEKISISELIYRLVLINAGCPQNLPSTNAERILLSGLLLANITITGLFIGLLYNSFAHDMYYPDINTLRDLDKSGLAIVLFSLGVADLFDDDNNSTVMQNLRNKVQYGENSEPNAAHYRNESTFVREKLFPIVNVKYVDVNGAPLLHLVKECPGIFFLSYLLPKNSILQEAINTLIGQLNQAGLTLLWSKQTVHNGTVQMRAESKQKVGEYEMEINSFVPFNLSDVQSSFYMLLLGLFISTIVFFHEKGWLKPLSSSRIKRSDSEPIYTSHQTR